MKNEGKLSKAMVSLKKGNLDALETIYSLTRKGVYSFILPILHTHERSEDIMQDTYIMVYEKISLYDEDKNPLNWILTIAKNLALTDINKSNRELDTDFSDPINENRVYSNDSKEFDTPTIDLARRILNEEELQIVLMFAIGEYKHREISEILNLPLGTVTWKYNQAIKKIRKAMKG